MRLSASVALGVGCVLVVQVSSFAFMPLGATPSGCTSCTAHSSQVTSGSGSSLRVRPSRLSAALSAADGEGASDSGEDMGDDDTSSAVATKPKRKVNAELDDLVSEMAGRSDDDPIVIPRGAGIAPMAPGPIKPDPIPGMDDDDIPGKIVLPPDVLAEQQKGLEKIAQQLRRERLDKEAEDAITFGFCPRAELWNGRSAMFGITVGMLTEYWTGQSIPQQIETFAQLLGLLPLDYDTYFQ
ncbi:unnamed protein product [Ectocarpus sp. 12 AP-2014]